MALSTEQIDIIGFSRREFGTHCGNVYYYQGNYYYPVNLTGRQPGMLRGAIARFERNNAALIKADRSDPAYVAYADLLDLSHPAEESYTPTHSL